MSKNRTVAIRKIDLMHKMFGASEGQNCGDCDHFFHYRHHGRSYFKCDVYGESNCDATDWRKKYPACGLYNKPHKGGNIKNLVGYENWRETDRDPIPGQISFEEEK